MLCCCRFSFVVLCITPRTSCRQHICSPKGYAPVTSLFNRRSFKISPVESTQTMATLGPGTLIWFLAAAWPGHNHHVPRWQADLFLSLLLTAIMVDAGGKQASNLCGILTIFIYSFLHLSISLFLLICADIFPILIRHSWPAVRHSVFWMCQLFHLYICWSCINSVDFQVLWQKISFNINPCTSFCVDIRRQWFCMNTKEADC